MKPGLKTARVSFSHENHTFRCLVGFGKAKAVSAGRPAVNTKESGVNQCDAVTATYTARLSNRRAEEEKRVGRFAGGKGKIMVKS